MIPIPVYLAAEDVPGLAAGRRLLAEHPDLQVYREENGRGFGNLKRKTPSYDRMAANGIPVLMLTDLDRDPCPSGKVADWLGRAPNRGFLFRVCVREVEAWLLADGEAMAAFLRVRVDRLPADPETLVDPKAALIRLAQAAPRPIRKGLTPVGSAAIGPDYNELLTTFVVTNWSIDRAVKRAPSLARARQRVAELANSAAGIP